MYQTIVEEELERLSELIKNKELKYREKFCDYWDYEDEYSHNEIDEAIRLFICRTENYFTHNNYPYKVRYGIGNALVENIENIV